MLHIDMNPYIYLSTANLVKVKLCQPNEEETDHIVTIQDILFFFTASPVIPAQGFEKELLLSFDHSAKLATSATCQLHLRLPVQFQDFREMMISSIFDDNGFGLR